MPLLLSPHHQLLLLFLLLAAASHGVASGATYDSSMCLSEPFTCGAVSFSYPFYRSSDRKDVDGNENSYCGYPGMGIVCDNDKPMLQLDGVGNYAVKSIDGTRANVSIADPEAVGSCPRVDHNVTFGPGTWLEFPNTTVDYLVFFLSCYFGAGLVKPATLDPITCSEFVSGVPGASFVFPNESVPAAGNWSQACRQVILVPVFKYGPVDPSNSTWRNTGYGDVLRQGFQVSWDNRPVSCTQCEESNGRCAYKQTGEFHGCLCTNGQIGARSCTTYNSTGQKKDRIKIYTIAGISSIMLCLLLFAFWLGYKKYGRKKKSKETARIESFLQKNGTIHPKRYTYAQVKRMTSSFAEKLGQGGFGAVYRGSFSDGRQIAVKMLKDYKTDGEDFINEVASISRTSHVNIVTLIGFCLEGSKRALIYDYMPNGSLERYAFKDNSQGGNTLGWEKLFDIAVGIARGLEYLHRGCNTRIVHFDIKPHNILLDQDFCPKISDFGLAKLCLNKESAISIGGARGTIGYIAPEVYSKQFGVVSSKSDVYSYGMMVLEMVGARDKNISANCESSSQYFPQWIYEHLDEYCVSASEINGEITETVRKMIVVGLWCIQLSATDRPTMTRVVEMLEGSTSVLELPPKVLFS
ncbi:LEAF RUST 10 DISEASE-RESISTANCEUS RECEPTOR-LIKE PROTEIN KINASE-like 2.4 isoform X2 [Lolium perenne]|uniref:LEAF RUST 10 DISEASE-RESISTANCEUS RECEPTOR-LIKE PROTEIN KINASE-like 2.4 isoform X2 n=1 Tax=Lolium perenne TaxID=4522 RepID=UPI0021EB1C7B|nr:LEAF RUST 10 DISEASE-RESISTANCE LOCUS RECEPTOR-LIKE PROTEIN KINASE-like 2.4 isoform X2 [Lolium perenne]